MGRRILVLANERKLRGRRGRFYRDVRDGLVALGHSLTQREVRPSAGPIASIGVGVRHWLTIHGFALNVCCDLSRFGAIVPCGLPGVRMVSVSSVLGRAVGLEEATDRVEARLREVFA